MAQLRVLRNVARNLSRAFLVAHRQMFWPERRSSEARRSQHGFVCHEPHYQPHARISSQSDWRFSFIGVIFYCFEFFFVFSRCHSRPRNGTAQLGGTEIINEAREWNVSTAVDCVMINDSSRATLSFAWSMVNINRIPSPTMAQPDQSEWSHTCDNNFPASKHSSDDSKPETLASTLDSSSKIWISLFFGHFPESVIACAVGAAASREENFLN